MPQYLPWDAIELVEQNSYRVLLYGPPGTGKTRSAYNTALALGKNFYNITLSDETPAAELRGHYIPKGQLWEFMFGPAVKAAVDKKGAVLLLDELDKASQDCRDFLHGFLNDPEVSQMTLPNGKVIEPTDGFQVIATMNADIGDLEPAMQDRFSISIEVTEPHPDAIAALPEDLRGVAAKVESYEAQQRPATLRRWAAFASLREIEGIGAETAARAVFAHRAQELMDAIGIKEMKGEPIPTPHSNGSGEACTCDDCRYERAVAWVGYTYEKTIDPDSDGDFRCPACGEYHSEERTAYFCCYDEGHWISFCDSEGIDYS
jgi:DNA polymerase III delta prime subunit